MPDISAVRSFNRFYTKQIGILHQGYLDSPFSLSEGRVLYELAHRDHPTATAIAKDLDLDPGYLSRILVKFEKLRLIARTREDHDARSTRLSLTSRGRAAFTKLDRGAEREVRAMLSKLAPPERASLIASMGTIERLLTAQPPDPKTPYLIRTHQPGDIGWIIHRHGVLYAQEQGWDERFEAEVAEIAARFINHFDSKARALLDRRERRRDCWLHFPGSQNHHHRPIAPVPGRALRARLGHRQPPGRRMHPLRPPSRLSQDHPLDPVHSLCRSPHLFEARIPPHSSKSAIAASDFSLIGETWELKL